MRLVSDFFLLSVCCKLVTEKQWSSPCSQPCIEGFNALSKQGHIENQSLMKD